MFRSLPQKILCMFEKHPITMNGALGGTIYVAGEITSQVCQNSKSRPVVTNQSALMWHINAIDWNRSARLGALGTIENGFFMLTWFRLLNRVVGDGVSTGLVLTKCFYDQIFFATQQDFLFLVLCAYNDSALLPAALEEVRRAFLSTWLMDCALWPIVNFVAFAWVPWSLQPTYIAAVQFFWQVYVSTVAARADKKPSGSHRDEAYLWELFCRMDADSSGYLDESELRNVLLSRGQKLTKQQLKEVMREVDENNDGLLSFEEFKHAVRHGSTAKTSLWAALREDVGLKYGTQAAMQRLQNVQTHSLVNRSGDPRTQPPHAHLPHPHPHPHHHQFHADQNPSLTRPSTSSPLPPANLSDSIATGEDPSTETAEEEEARELREAFFCAVNGVTVLTIAAAVRRLVFKI